jgi:hypothetical protein
MVDFNPQEFLKSRGYSDNELKKIFKAPGAEPAAAETPVAPPEPTGPDILDPKNDPIRNVLESRHPPPGHTPTDDELDWQQRAGKGVAKGLTNVGFQAEHLARYFFPSLDRLAKTAVPAETRKRLREFADEPSSGIAESVGRVGGEALPTAFAPTGFLGGKAATGLVGTGLRAAERAAGGAAGGALADPEHPGQGAVAGAAGAVAAPIGGAAFRSPLGRMVGQLGAGEGAYYGAHHLTGIPFHPFLGPAIVWHSSPVGRSLRRVGNAIMDQAGKIIGHINPATVGYGVSRAGASGVGQGVGESDFFNQMRRQYLPGQSTGEETQ